MSSQGTPYPSLEQYQEALQFPQICLVDPELKQGEVAKTGLGTPHALSGGFALTYTFNCQGKKYAVRCFHKKSNNLERRYDAISRRLKTLASSYFVDFEYQHNGITIAGNSFPIVKMAWAGGDTLGSFLRKKCNDRVALGHLRTSLIELESFLSQNGIAHGDLQPGNVMVSPDGRAVRLIDYDGMFVSELRSFGSSELGHRNFQHPGRKMRNFDERLDRFSFILLDVVLSALQEDESLWLKTQSDSDGFLFRANDFADPSLSQAFGLASSLAKMHPLIVNFERVCSASFDLVPALDDFAQGRNIPQASATRSATQPTVRRYLAAHQVIDASRVADCLQYVGDRVELIGRIEELRRAITRHNKPYVFLNFGDWRNSIAKVTIWSEGLAKLTKKPDDSWVGQWVSVVGLLEPYISKGRGYTHFSVEVTDDGQLSFITESEALFRIGTATRTLNGSRNADILDAMTGRSKPPPQVSGNQAVLRQIQASGTRTVPPAPNSWPNVPPPVSSSSNISQQATGSGCLVFLVLGVAMTLLGVGAEERLRANSWSALLPSHYSAQFVSKPESFAQGDRPEQKQRRDFLVERRSVL